MNKRAFLLIGAAICMVISRAFVQYSVIAAMSMLLATALVAVYTYPDYLTWSKSVKLFWGSYIILFWSFTLYMLISGYLGWSNQLIDYITIGIIISYAGVFVTWVIYKKVKLYLDLKQYVRSEDKK